MLTHARIGHACKHGTLMRKLLTNKFSLKSKYLWIFLDLLSHCYWLPIEKILPLGHSGNIGVKSFAEA